MARLFLCIYVLVWGFLCVLLFLQRIEDKINRYRWYETYASPQTSAQSRFSSFPSSPVNYFHHPRVVPDPPLRRPIKAYQLKRITLPRRCSHLICTHNIAAAFTSLSLTVPTKQIAHFELWAIIVLWCIRVFVGQKKREIEKKKKKTAKRVCLCLATL